MVKPMIDKLQIALDNKDSFAVSMLITRLKLWGFTVEIEDNVVTVRKGE